MDEVCERSCHFEIRKISQAPLTLGWLDFGRSCKTREAGSTGSDPGSRGLDLLLARGCARACPSLPSSGRGSVQLGGNAWGEKEIS